MGKFTPRVKHQLIPALLPSFNYHSRLTYFPGFFYFFWQS